MKVRNPSGAGAPFGAAREHFANVDAESSARLLTAAADIALVVDRDGVIVDLAVASEALLADGCSAWVGKHWIDTVSGESRQKVSELLRDASSTTMPAWRQVNHPMGRRPQLSVRYAAVQLTANGKILAIGRDMRAVAAVQQRLVDVQQTMTREYERLRHAETRYRLLFQISAEAILIVDPQSHRIVESNRSASRLVGLSPRRLQQFSVADLFDAEFQTPVRDFLSRVAASGRDEEAVARLHQSNIELRISASFFRQTNAGHVIARLTPTAVSVSAWRNSRSNLLDVVENLPDGFVVTNLERRILSANSAFVQMAQLASEEQALGESVDRWIGRHPIDMAIIGGTLRECGEIQNFATVVKGERGAREEAEVCAVSVLSGAQPCIGMTIRSVRRWASPNVNRARAMPRAVEQMASLVGRVPLADLVRESIEMIERLCIEAALELTNDNRSSAAHLLGLSRQTFYAKLHRLGISAPKQDLKE